MEIKKGAKDGVAVMSGVNREAGGRKDEGSDVGGEEWIVEEGEWEYGEIR